MADIKKEQGRDELHRAIWTIADEPFAVVDVYADIYNRGNQKLGLNIKVE